MKKILLATALLAVMATSLILATPKAKATTGCEYVVVARNEFPNTDRTRPGSFCVVWVIQEYCEGFPVDGEFFVGNCYDADGNLID